MTDSMSVGKEPCLIVRELAATPIRVLLVASLGKNSPRNQPLRFVCSLELSVGEDNLILFPSPVFFQLFREI